MSLDVKSMFWQVDMVKQDQNLAHTIFRESEDQPWKLYRHRRLVMGQVDAQSNAIQCLIKAAELEREAYPRVEHIIKSNTYADDIGVYRWTKWDVIKDAKDVAFVGEKTTFLVANWLLMTWKY